jgi:anti-anti-sigma factor
MFRGPCIELDLRDVTFMDSAGLRVLEAVHLRLGQLPEAVILRDPTPAVQRLLHLAGMEGLFAVRTAASR